MTHLHVNVCQIRWITEMPGCVLWLHCCINFNFNELLIYSFHFEQSIDRNKQSQRRSSNHWWRIAATILVFVAIICIAKAICSSNLKGQNVSHHDFLWKKINLLDRGLHQHMILYGLKYWYNHETQFRYLLILEPGKMSFFKNSFSVFEMDKYLLPEAYQHASLSSGHVTDSPSVGESHNPPSPLHW